MNFFLISNMYPTNEFPGYGSFVKNICNQLADLGIRQKYSAVIHGKAKSKLNKLQKYLSFYFKIFINFWRKYDFIYIHFPNQATPVLFPLLIFTKKN